MTWRDRLREAVDRDPRKHSAIAEAAGINPATLSRLLNGHSKPQFDAVVRIAHALGTSVGWLLQEPGYSLSAAQLRDLRTLADFAKRMLDSDKSARPE